jgi:hypothetical protein
VLYFLNSERRGKKKYSGYYYVYNQYYFFIIVLQYFLCVVVTVSAPRYNYRALLSYSRTVYSSIIDDILSMMIQIKCCYDVTIRRVCEAVVDAAPCLKRGFIILREGYVCPSTLIRLLYSTVVIW